MDDGASLRLVHSVADEGLTMKICLFDDYKPGLVKGDAVIDLSSVVGAEIMAQRPKHRMQAFIEAFGSLRADIERADGPSFALADVTLRAPVPRPGKILMGQGNFHEGLGLPRLPLGMFLKPSTAVLDPGGTVVFPPHDGEIVHHEAELAVVIGKEARNVSAATALDFVFGYTCILDVSLRSQTGGVSLVSKGFETFAPLGPWITTADEIPNPQKLAVKSWENDQPRQDYNTDDMEHSVAELIAWASAITTLEPGDVIGCGTNHQGIGPMQDGETCTMEIERIGRLSVKVNDPQKRRWPFQIDPGIGVYVRDWRRNGAPGPLTNVFAQKLDR
ncbi:MAG: fumarylacetoacetate hydrolase family protein [Caulobacterales bacterium]